MTEMPLSLATARALKLDPGVLKILAPEEVAKHAVVPLALERELGALLVAVDPTASNKAEGFLRVRCEVRRVEAMEASREAIAHLLHTHYFPYWTEKGWGFPGLPPVPGAEESEGLELVLVPRPLPDVESEGEETSEAGEADADEPVPPVRAEEPPEHHELLKDDTEKEAPVAEAPEERAEAPRAGPAREPSHPVVLVVETGRVRCRALATLMEEAGYEPRFAATREDVERELHRSPPHLVTVRRDGPVSPEELFGIVRDTRARSEIRVVPDYAQGLLGMGLGDERQSRFLFDLTRFLLGVISAAGGGRFSRAEARARHAERTARRVALKPTEIEAVRLAALLRDLDEILGRLRTEDGDEESTSVMEMLRPLLAPDRTPFPVAAALDAAEESYDGSGRTGLKGEMIPAAGRVLAAVDAFLDLRDEGLGQEEIEARLRSLGGTALDPRMVEALLRADRAERLVDLLDEDREQLILVDPDPVAASLLEMRLANAGFGVRVHRDGRSALDAALEHPPALILSEVGVPLMDGFTLLLRLRKAEETADIPFLFISERTDRSATVRGLEAGADDFLAKPVDLELLAAKVKGLVRKARARRPSKAAPAGVSGDLAEMELVELLQVLAATGRTVRIRLERAGAAVGEMSLEQGRVVHAVAGEEEGIDAFNVLLATTEGRFTVESAPPPADRTIDAPLESLLLEACRLLDEASRQAEDTVESVLPA